MADISLTLPDGTARDYAAGVTPAEVAADIATSLAKKAISAQVDGAHWDLQWPIPHDAAIAINTMRTRPPRSNSSVTISRISWPAPCRRSGPR